MGSCHTIAIDPSMPVSGVEEYEIVRVGRREHMLNRLLLALSVASRVDMPLIGSHQRHNRNIMLSRSIARTLIDICEVQHTCRTA